MSDLCLTHIHQYWKQLTIKANKKFDNREIKRSLPLYQEAMYRAEVLSYYVAECNRLKLPFLQIYIISCNNLANAFIDLGHVFKAEKLYKGVITYLLSLKNNEFIDQKQWQSELRKASLVYLSFKKNNYVNLLN
ncbi:tetratricopeptide repeat protein [Myroides pelagicus]|uniref:Tetratricopeptide repeat protein n=1 Tax=Myroides pelagicus TaxID=270914 RepID=A0A7K1GNS3_9FLAO|nr:tetratricopeptide repeat protein [Myroides pelagicus]MEC4113420.1 tetratricopeptide repeat protein [Myroides pelagicus]MTH30491.1 tetratricopeptide repeat protein [Myroides pelagicus]